MKFKKKPVVIEAYQYDGDGPEALNWAASVSDGNGTHLVIQPGFGLYIKTLEGRMHVSPGDFIICGIHGEFYPCKQDIFKESYEPAE